MARIHALVTEEKGIQHAEEALLIALIGVALVATVGTLKGKIGDVFNAAGTKMVVTP